jgi:putative ABC transport system permease protein
MRRLNKFRAMFRKPRMETELDDELRFHLEKQIEQNIARGMSAEEARYAALRQFGNVGQVKEECRDAWGVRFISELAQDVRYGLRQLRRNPGFTIVAVLTLALGIGANTAIFSVVEAVILRPLPFNDPSRLVLLTDPQDPDNGGLISRDFSPLLSEATDFKAIDFYYRDSGFSRVTLTTSDGPHFVQGAFVSANFFSLMGVAPELGRVFTQEEVDRHERVVVLSHRLWLSQFGGSRDALSQPLRIDRARYQIVGVMPSSFQFPASDQQFWAPITTNPFWGEALIPNNNPLRPQHNRYFYERWQAIGRLKPSASLAQAQAQISTIYARLRQQDPDENRGVGIELVPLRVHLGGHTRLALYLLFGAVCFVLLIACSNVANLLLARGTVRAREIAVRSALGASRGRLVRQLFGEAIVLTLLGGSVGLAVASGGVRALVALAPSGIPRMAQVGINGVVLAFTLVTSLAAAVLIGLAPAWKISHRGPEESLKFVTQGAAGSIGWRRMLGTLVVAEFALAVLLLAGAGLTLRSLLDALSVKPGFNPANLLTMSISPSAKTPQGRNALYDEVLTRVRALPGVQAAGEVSELFELGPTNPLSLREVEGRFPEPKDRWTPLNWVSVRGDFFQAMGTPLLRGRYFSTTDGPNSPLVAIIDESMARRFWPGEDPIGQRFKGFDPRGHNDGWISVVGIAPDMRRSGLKKKPIAHIYEPYTQAIDGNRTGDLVVRTSNSPLTVAPILRRVVHKLDPAAILSGVSTVQADLSEQLAPERFQTRLFGFFAVIALILAGVGIFGVIHYSVSQRTHELGVRMALGADKSDVLKMVVRQGLKLALIGVAIGVAGALALTRFLSSLLYGVKPTDPLTFIAVSVILVGVALVACYIPARRAAKVDPMVALRYE